MFIDKVMNKSYTMKPNDLVIYDKVSNDYLTEVVQPQKYLSWTEGKLVFRDDPLDVIARRLERLYNIDVEVDEDIYDDFRLHAIFIGDNLDEVLNLMKRSLPINYKIINRELKPDGTYSKKKVINTSRKKIYFTYLQHLPI